MESKRKIVLEIKKISKEIQKFQKIHETRGLNETEESKLRELSDKVNTLFKILKDAEKEAIEREQKDRLGEQRRVLDNLLGLFGEDDDPLNISKSINKEVAIGEIKLKDMDYNSQYWLSGGGQDKFNQVFFLSQEGGVPMFEISTPFNLTKHHIETDPAYIPFEGSEETLNSYLEYVRKEYSAYYYIPGLEYFLWLLQEDEGSGSISGGFRGVPSRVNILFPGFMFTDDFGYTSVLSLKFTGVGSFEISSFALADEISKDDEFVVMLLPKK